MSQPDNTPETPPLPTTPAQLFELFEELGISYELHHHPRFYTVEEGLEFEKDIPGTHCRNLYLRDKKKRNFLLTAANETEIDLKKLAELLGSARLSFGSAERLWQFLGIQPGSVCPFCAINDSDHQVQIVLDKAAMGSERINVHPLDNAMTAGITPADLLKFFRHTGHDPLVLDLTAAAPDPKSG